MRLLAAIGLTLLFAVGAGLGLALAVLIVPISFYRRARAVHAEGVVCRGELIARDPVAARLAGPVLVRLSGALAAQTAGSDILGVALRMQRTASDDARDGDQDLLLGSFESFHTVGRDRARTDAGDYLANRYSTVTPWWLPGRGAVTLRLVPLPAPPGSAAPPPAPPGSAAPVADRLARLDAALAADRARLALAIGTGPEARGLAELRLIARIATDDRALRTSMWRQGRGVRPLGLRNGIRATLYPLSQIARRLRGG
ncbi:MAG TPA: hypothetical protein VH165_30250 [Kofleriaceae bacterium]|nr:hypothetical protein [Kofleriaceae bacterium]